MQISLRRAERTDADAVADVYLASRKACVSFAPPAHSDAEVRRWIADVLIPSGGVTVAVRGEQIVGMMATVHEQGYDWIDQLYLDPAFVGAGIGSLLLAQAKQQLNPPIRLYTFQANAGARRFYERHGFRAIAFGDGQGNEEKCPDVLYEWTPAV
jgi:ribosomal protein S18 acetylase RimI-like enzyme